MRREALIRNAHASTSIEGNPLSIEEVSALAEGRKITAMRKSRLEVLNYLKVLEDIPKFAEKESTEKTVLDIHKRITKDVIEDPRESGRYRKKRVVVGNRLGRIVYTPPPPAEVPRLMKGFVVWLGSAPAQSIDAVLEAGIAHYEFVRIHPFVDGNGRTARALATLILYARGFDIKRFFALDDYYDSDRAAYYRALQSVDPNDLDLTSWLEYFTDGVAISVLSVKERVLRLSSDRLRRDIKGQISLTDRQMRIVELIHGRGAISSKELQQLFHISRQATHKEISKLVKLGVIKSVGKARATRYVFV